MEWMILFGSDLLKLLQNGLNDPLFIGDADPLWDELNNILLNEWTK